MKTCCNHIESVNQHDNSVFYWLLFIINLIDIFIVKSMWFIVGTWMNKLSFFPSHSEWCPKHQGVKEWYGVKERNKRIEKWEKYDRRLFTFGQWTVNICHGLKSTKIYFRNTSDKCDIFLFFISFTFNPESLSPFHSLTFFWHIVSGWSFFGSNMNKSVYHFGTVGGNNVGHRPTTSTYHYCFPSHKSELWKWIV